MMHEYNSYYKKNKHASEYNSLYLVDWSNIIVKIFVGRCHNLQNSLYRPLNIMTIL